MSMMDFDDGGYMSSPSQQRNDAPQVLWQSSQMVSVKELFDDPRRGAVRKSKKPPSQDEPRSRSSKKMESSRTSSLLARTGNILPRGLGDSPDAPILIGTQSFSQDSAPSTSTPTPSASSSSSSYSALSRDSAMIDVPPSSLAGSTWDWPSASTSTATRSSARRAPPSSSSLRRLKSRAPSHANVGLPNTADEEKTPERGGIDLQQMIRQFGSVVKERAARTASSSSTGAMSQPQLLSSKTKESERASRHREGRLTVPSPPHLTDRTNDEENHTSTRDFEEGERRRRKIPTTRPFLMPVERTVSPSSKLAEEDDSEMDTSMDSSTSPDSPASLPSLAPTQNCRDIPPPPLFTRSALPAESRGITAPTAGPPSTRRPSPPTFSQSPPSHFAPSSSQVRRLGMTGQAPSSSQQKAAPALPPVRTMKALPSPPPPSTNLATGKPRSLGMRVGISPIAAVPVVAKRGSLGAGKGAGGPKGFKVPFRSPVSLSPVPHAVAPPAPPRPLPETKDDMDEGDQDGDISMLSQKATTTVAVDGEGDSSFSSFEYDPDELNRIMAAYD